MTVAENINWARGRGVSKSEGKKALDLGLLELVALKQCAKNSIILFKSNVAILARWPVEHNVTIDAFYPALDLKTAQHML